LLHVLGGLIEPTEGRVERGEALSSLVFQGSNLLPHFTASENVAFARRAAGRSGPAEDELLGLVGLAAKVDSLPSELSGGEAQRVAIARALAQSPDLLLCDEPTGHLDSDTGERVLDLIEALKEELGFTLVIATHDADVAGRLDRLVLMRDGRIVE
jgi:putative ABC transport system ATP-binding protein